MLTTSASRAAQSAGFTLVELMVAVGVLGVLTVVGLPTFKQMLQNYQVRVAAESVANGLRSLVGEAHISHARESHLHT